MGLNIKTNNYKVIMSQDMEREINEGLLEQTSKFGFSISKPEDECELNILRHQFFDNEKVYIGDSLNTHIIVDYWIRRSLAVLISIIKSTKNNVSASPLSIRCTHSDNYDDYESENKHVWVDNRFPIGVPLAVSPEMVKLFVKIHDLALGPDCVSTNIVMGISVENLHYIGPDQTTNGNLSNPENWAQIKGK